MYENRAFKTFEGAHDPAEIEDRPHDEQRRNGGPARELRVAAQ